MAGEKKCYKGYRMFFVYIPVVQQTLCRVENFFLTDYTFSALGCAFVFKK